MPRVLKYYYLISILIGFVLTSCIDDNITNLDNSLVFTPEYSVPIGFGGFTMEDVISSPNFDTIAADTTNWSDSIYFEYDSSFYYLPPDAVFDTTLREDFDFSLIDNWLDNATYIMFRMNIENAIPGGVLTQVAFSDATNNVVFTLFDDPGIEIPAAANNNSIFRQEDTYLSPEEIIALRNVTQITSYIRIKIENITGGVSYRPNQYFKLQMGLRVGLVMDPNEEKI